MKYDIIRNSDLYLELDNRRARSAQLSNTPVNSDHRLNTWAVFAQDRWMIGRATLNYGLRVDGLKGFLPPQSSPAGAFVGERSFGEIDVFDFMSVAPRLGLSYDLVGNGRTALKAYYGRFYNQFGSELGEAVNQNARINFQVPWNDTNNNLLLDPGELNLTNFTGFTSVFPRMDSDATRPYSDEMNIGIDHQLLPNFAISASYHRRQHRNGLGLVDLARPASAYTPITRAFDDPQRGPQTITVYNLDPTLVNRRDRVITNVDVLESDYNGMSLSFNKRMSNRWQLLGGVTFQKHHGFAHSGTYTSTTSNTDFNDPNFVLNRDDSSVFIDLPWAFNVSGSYQLPYELVFSGKYSARAGDPLMRTLNVTGLTQGSEVVWVQPRGDDRTETVTKFMDIRISKRLNMGSSHFEGTFDVFNVLNANHVLEQNPAVGGSIGRPTRIMTPRIIRFGITTRF
jgi:hypothetical protein